MCTIVTENPWLAVLWQYRHSSTVVYACAVVMPIVSWPKVLRVCFHGFWIRFCHFKFSFDLISNKIHTCVWNELVLRKQEIIVYAISCMQFSRLPLSCLNCRWPWLHSASSSSFESPQFPPLNCCVVVLIVVLIWGRGVVVNMVRCQSGTWLPVNITVDQEFFWT